jgi:7-cyano-7-deazaguanine synthase
MKHILLLSGGIDSTALLHYLLGKKRDVLCVHFQYGQSNDISEKKSVEKITSYYKCDLKIINLEFPKSLRKNELIGRNTYFILAGSSLGFSPAIIYLGIHKGTDYYDCSNRFIKDVQNILDGYFAGTVQIETPFINNDKSDIISYCEKNNVPLNMTYSCLIKNFPPCGKCSSCLERGVYNEYK